MLPRTSERVPAHTRPEINARIRQAAEGRIAYYAEHRGEIGRRLHELDQEWDIERTLEVNGSVLAMTGLVLGALRARKWFLLPTTVVGFCLQHALHGWCPPLSLFRRFGIRTQREIDEERTALRALRGDFEHLSPRKRTQDGKHRTRNAAARLRT
jgi:hypothetical protein